MKGNKKVINAWAMYDWANSVYSLTIVTAVFPIYYLGITSAPDGSAQMVNFFGFAVNNVSLYSWSLSVSFLIAVIIAPLLSGIADYTGNKKVFMQFFCYLGSVSCCALYFFTGPENLNMAMIAFVLAGIGFTGSIVFYNAYLPEIAEEKDQDHVSAKGFALGYVGSVLLLVFNLAMIMNPGFFGLPDIGMASRISFVTVGIWWAAFSQITFYYLPKSRKQYKWDKQVFIKGYIELMQVVHHLKFSRILLFFLGGFFFYSMGLQTVLYLAPTFAEKAIRMEKESLIMLMLIIQIVAIAGAYIFSWTSGRIGNIKTLQLAILAWIFIVGSVFFIYTPGPFIAAAVGVGMVMGGTQALSRSTYSKLIPKSRDNASFFSFFDIAEKVAIVGGTLTFGVIFALTGEMRNTLFAIISFFLLGMLLLVLLGKIKTQPESPRTTVFREKAKEKL